MPAYAVTTEIAVPIDVVFAAVSDLTTHPEWSADELEVTPFDDSPAAVGKAYRSTVTAGGKTISAELEITRFDAPHIFGFTVRDLTGAYNHEFRLDQGESTTRVTRRVESTLGPRQWLLYQAVFRPIKLPNSKRALTRLKALCESRVLPSIAG